MQDVHVLPEHLNDGLLLRVMPVTYERLDVFVILGNKRQEPGKRIRRSVFDDAPGDAMDGIGVVSAQNGNERESKLVGS